MEMEKAQTIFGTGFNCTFMELKSDGGAAAEGGQRALIVPLWN